MRSNNKPNATANRTGPNIILADHEKGKNTRQFVATNPNAIGRAVLSIDAYNNASLYVGTVMPCLAEVSIPVPVDKNILGKAAALKDLISYGLECLAEDSDIVAGLETYHIPVEFGSAGPESFPLTA